MAMKTQDPIYWFGESKLHVVGSKIHTLYTPKHQKSHPRPKNLHEKAYAKIYKSHDGGGVERLSSCSISNFIKVSFHMVYWKLNTIK